ncbi:Ca-activated chloride channel family protein [Nonomuraea fuscirosea]|uniref:Ca-activated chloride channel family protein n=1 Tax=Nonomuraea fuscirosea TaxID=1291556 RepID=A0A2T0M7W7_9ACTN|nr:VWA domain-containing protein [Nonomuraea fuscirosea]PRX53598.1 Ca-activated chloride channel family protein [Nonomuraea fuscirosea]
MTFSWPWALLSILIIPLILGIRWWALRRRRRAAVRVTSIALVRSALPGRTRWIRKIPPALFVTGLALLAVGAARPQASVPVPQTAATILLALDTSGSMCSTDVDPNRLTAAKKAATDFIESLEGGPRIGLVTFSGSAGLLVPPTDDTDALTEALDNLTVGRGTAIGQAMLASLDAIAEVDPSVAPTGASPDPGSGEGHAAAAIIVLTDGANTQGVDPQTAAQEAALRRVRVYPIGFGTTTPAPMVCENTQFDGRGFGGWGGGWGGGGGFDRGGRNIRMIDEPALKQIAQTTGGAYHRAENADELKTALEALPGSFSVVNRRVDTAAAFAAGGALFVVAALSLSLWWNRPRTPTR